jgi:Ni/Fe-hydrogenase subunit HybB-like protein
MLRALVFAATCSELSASPLAGTMVSSGMSGTFGSGITTIGAASFVGIAASGLLEGSKFSSG